jgi:DNA-binding CsgD family transcriptional regulator
MDFKIKIFFIMFCLGTLGSIQGISQQCIEGFIIQTYRQQYFSIGLLGMSESKDDSIFLEVSSLDRFGYFTFSCNFKRYPYYRLVISDELSDSSKYQNLLEDCALPIFLLKNEGELDFSKDSCLSTDLSLNVNAFHEWKRFIKFQARTKSAENDSSLRSNTRDFIKDSIEILLVKLFGTRTLNEKNLLSVDIKENPFYYEGFLNELKDSSIEPMYYLFLETEILKSRNEILTSKFQLSLWANILLIFALILALMFIVKRIIKDRKNPNSLLSFQENKIKELIMAGKSNKQIGAELYISVNTVKTHISNIYQKLGIRSRKDLINR